MFAITLATTEVASAVPSAWIPELTPSDSASEWGVCCCGWGQDMKPRGSITQLSAKHDYGCILGEDGCMVYFDESSLEGLDPRRLSVGNWVEYEERYWGDRLRAAKITPIPQPDTP